MISVYSVLYTLVLFSELSSHLVTVAMPATKIEDGATEENGLGLLLGDESMTEPAVVPAMVPPVYRRSHLLDNSVRDEDESPRIIIVSGRRQKTPQKALVDLQDMRLKGHSTRGLTPAFAQNLLTTRSLSNTPAEHSPKIDRRDTDLDMLRCMIGRVYRPCWEV